MDVLRVEAPQFTADELEWLRAVQNSPTWTKVKAWLDARMFATLLDRSRTDATMDWRAGWIECRAELDYLPKPETIPTGEVFVGDAVDNALDE